MSGQRCHPVQQSLKTLRSQLQGPTLSRQSVLAALDEVAARTAGLSASLRRNIQACGDCRESGQVVANGQGVPQFDPLTRLDPAVALGVMRQTLAHDTDDPLPALLEQLGWLQRAVDEAMRGQVYACPRCGSLDVEIGDAMYEFVHLACHACGCGEWADDWQRQFDWSV